MKNLQSYDEFINEKYSGTQLEFFTQYLKEIAKSFGDKDVEKELNKFTPGTIDDAYNTILDYIPKEKEAMFLKLVKAYLNTNKMGHLSESLVNEKFTTNIFNADEIYKFAGLNSNLDIDLFVGRLEITEHNKPYYLYTLDATDRDLTKDTKVNPGEILVRYDTDLTRQRKISNIMKINQSKGIVWFNKGSQDS